MKIIKNIFNSKTKQNTKYEPNTLAEMNGSPDLRLATAKEKEVNILTTELTVYETAVKLADMKL